MTFSPNQAVGEDAPVRPLGAKEFAANFGVSRIVPRAGRVARPYETVQSHRTKFHLRFYWTSSHTRSVYSPGFSSGRSAIRSACA